MLDYGLGKAGYNSSAEIIHKSLTKRTLNLYIQSAAIIWD